MQGFHFCNSKIIALVISFIVVLQCTPGSSQTFLGQIGKKLYFSMGRSTWIQAVEGCHSVNLMMGTIDSKEENDFVASFLSPDEPGQTYPHWFWLPMTDFFGEGNFIWLHNGKNLNDTFNNWEIGEPNIDLSSNCGYVYPNGKWGDTQCTSTYASGLCQIIPV